MYAIGIFSYTEFLTRKVDLRSFFSRVKHTIQVERIFFTQMMLEKIRIFYVVANRKIACVLHSVLTRKVDFHISSLVSLVKKRRLEINFFCQKYHVEK